MLQLPDDSYNIVSIENKSGNTKKKQKGAKWSDCRKSL